ncbi:MAG: hypothetical protein AAF447_22000 [Myxococcota bacterium]
MTPGLETLALEARSAQKTAESPEAALSAEARRCVQAVLATIRLLPAGAMVAWPCFGLSVSRPSSDDAGNAILMTLRVRRSGAVLRLRDTPRGLEVYETRSWGSLPVLHHRASEIARRIEGAVDLAAFARVV